MNPPLLAQGDDSSENKICIIVSIHCAFSVRIPEMHYYFWNSHSQSHVTVYWRALGKAICERYWAFGYRVVVTKIVQNLRRHLGGDACLLVCGVVTVVVAIERMDL